jgi:hypothetical protein
MGLFGGGSHKVKVYVTPHNQFNIPISTDVSVPVDVDTSGMSQAILDSAALQVSTDVYIVQSLKKTIKSMGNSISVIMALFLVFWIFKK